MQYSRTENHWIELKVQLGIDLEMVTFVYDSWDGLFKKFQAGVEASVVNCLFSDYYWWDHKAVNSSFLLCMS